MAHSNVDSTSSRNQRLRSQALWAFLLAGTGLLAAVAGLGQYLASGEISMPGRDAVKGNAALGSLIFLFLTSAAFGVVGVVMRWCAKRGGIHPMPRPERIIVGIAGLLFVLAAVLEGLSRLGDQPALHDVATWVLMAALFAVLTPIAVATAVVAYQTLIARKKDRDSDAA